MLCRAHLVLPDERDRAVQKLRDLHVEMDRAVAAAYRWDDLDVGHGFHTTKQGVRFTLSEPARQEVLARLLELNHARCAEEVAAGLHEKDAKKKGKALRPVPVPDSPSASASAAPLPTPPPRSQLALFEAAPPAKPAKETTKPRK